jgi:fructose-bisphosphate aldolase class II
MLCAQISWKERYMQDLRYALEQAQNNGLTPGHFNVADLVLLKAVFATARELSVPVLVGV